MRRILKTIIATLFGVIFTLLLFEISLFAFGRLKRLVQKKQNNFSKTDEFVILALGESTTASMHDLNMKDYSWPVTLQKLLDKEITDKKIRIINKGEVAVNSDRILNDLEKNLEKYDPDLVISMMGINDYFGEIAYETAANIEVDSLLSKSRTYKLIKFLIANVKDKIQLNTKEEFDCYSEESCLHLASIQRENDFYETELAIKFLNKALEYNPNNVDAMINLGYRYMSPYNQNRDNDTSFSIKWFEKALEHNVKNTRVYNGLVQSLINMVSYDEMWIEKIKVDMAQIQQNIEKNGIRDPNLFLTLATCQICFERENFEQEKRIFYLNKALETDPQNPDVLIEFARYHVQHKNFNEAEKLYLQVLEIDLKNEIYITILIELANLYIDLNKEKLASETFRKAINLGGIYIKNYQQVYKILKSNNIELIAVQYPMRSIEPLELIFENNNGVLLVDNELLFKSAVKEKGYEQFFVDRFAGDFGHCSEEGNLLLARNIASVILENWEKISGEN